MSKSSLEMNWIESLYVSIWYYYYDYWDELSDPRMSNYFLIKKGPDKVLAIICSYLLLVTVIGPRLMQNRRPFLLKGPMIVYNFFMVMTNGYFFLYLLNIVNYKKMFFDFKFPNQKDDFSENAVQEIRMLFLCYLTRFLDLLDTIFFVLRKKSKQITLLHLYHHSFVPILGWMAMKIAPQVPGIKLFLLLNCLVHTIMYLYYGLAALGPQTQKYLWWKRHITQLQLAQFVIFTIYGIIMVFHQEGYPVALFWISFAQNPFFLYMFLDFYRKTYKNRFPK